MLIDTRPKDEAVAHNIADISEFKIRATAKSFAILSSGLYSDKIAAIVRELSCNAKDSHVAAGTPTVPFNLHLPTRLEPWFSIRDFGTGLTKEQVIKVYTTYFESTKTDSNEFIGALGLGSKTPFSYTTNFTVVSYKDGIQGIYTAFINDLGIPSIAVMSESETSESNGLEVKFAVENTSDFYRFEQAASNVFKYFEVLPNFTGSKVIVPSVKYDKQDIIPGVSTLQSSSTSIAVMGNIAYPIDSAAFGEEHRRLLRSGLEMKFNIGELDIQASREGLSYIPQTVNAIKIKLNLLSSQLNTIFAKMCNDIPNVWERAAFLVNRASSSLWSSAAYKYIEDNPSPILSSTLRFNELFIDLTKVKSDFNISVDTMFVSGLIGITPGHLQNTTQHLKISAVPDRIWFVVDDIKTSVNSRVKYHRQQTRELDYNVVVLSAADAAKPMNVEGFLASLWGPPAHRVLKASTLKVKPTKKRTVSDPSALMLSYSYPKYTWENAGKLSEFDPKEKYYYLPLSGFSVLTKAADQYDAKDLRPHLSCSGINALESLRIFGIRKKDIDNVKGSPIWLNLEDRISEILSTISDSAIDGFVSSELSERHRSVVSSVANLISPTSDYHKLIKLIGGRSSSTFSTNSIRWLDNMFGTGEVVKRINSKISLAQELLEKYPLIKYLYNAPKTELAHYINLVDASIPVANTK